MERGRPVTDLRVKAHCLAAVLLLGLATEMMPSLTDEALAANPPNAIDEPRSYLRRLTPKFCVAAREDLNSVSTALPDFRFIGSKLGTSTAPEMHFDWRAEKPWGSVRATAVTSRGKLRGITVEIWHGEKPQVMALAGPICRLGSGRKVVYAEDGKPEAVAVYGSGFKRLLSIEPLDPPVPPGKGHDGLRVGMIDSGVAYDQRFIADHLARRPDGSLVGYDYWDDDPRPYDLDSGRSLFLARRHGTLVASLLLAEAPEVALVPYRFPSRSNSRIAALVEAAARDNVRIIGMPLGSSRKESWRAFEAAARAHPDILFIIAAGNQGRDIDEQPVYPASLRLSNALVATSSTANGRLAERANWGAQSVDLMVPVDRLVARGANGRKRRATGTSMAASRVTALAARLAAANPNWRAAELKAAILAHAEALPESSSKWVRYGWIPNPKAIATSR